MRLLKRFNALDALFPQLGLESHLEGLADAWAFPFEAQSPLSISESDDDLLITLNLPGIKAEDVELNFDRGLLSILAKRQEAAKPEGAKPLRSELAKRKLEQRLRISDDFDVDAIDALLVDGVLSLRLPRKPERRPRRIEVKIS